MAISKKTRQLVYDKYGGRCAYTGCMLEDDWQVDHLYSQNQHKWDTYNGRETIELNHIDNLLPANRNVNFYKSSMGLERFREYMGEFHIRLSKLPKKTTVERTKNRIRFMNKLAEQFDITPDKPFCGKFYFETL